MPRHTKHLTLQPVDPAPVSGFAESPDELAEGVLNSAEARRFLGGISQRQLDTLAGKGRVRVLQDGNGYRKFYPQVGLKNYLRSMKTG